MGYWLSLEGLSHGNPAVLGIGLTGGDSEREEPEACALGAVELGLQGNGNCQWDVDRAPIASLTMPSVHI